MFYVDGWADGRTDGRTDMTKLTVTLRSNVNAPKMVRECLVTIDVCIQSAHEERNGHTFHSLLWFM